MSTFTEQLNSAYFWDIAPSNLDEVKSKRLIIERVMNFGNFDEIKLLKEFYGEKVIINTLCTLSYIDPKTLNFISLFFNVPKTKFKCYSRKQSTNQPWNY